MNNKKYKDCLEVVLEEVLKAKKKFPPFNSTHEGYAVIKEEVDELWDEIKGGAKSHVFFPHTTDEQGAEKHKRNLYAEAKQIAAMAICFMAEIDTMTKN